MNSSADHTVFTASNGRRVTEEGGRVRVLNDRGRNMLDDYDYLSAGDIQALRERFAADDDARFGRWRSAEHPEYFVHAPRGVDGAVHAVRVVCEASGESVNSSREIAARRGQFGIFFPFDPRPVARAYFDAHPEPKPWHDAKPGEVWVISWGPSYVDVPVTVSESAHFTHNLGFVPIDRDVHDIGAFAPGITDGRRIWPEVSA